MINDALQYRIM